MGLANPCVSLERSSPNIFYLNPNLIDFDTLELIEKVCIKCLIVVINFFVILLQHLGTCSVNNPSA
jgi:hypothetical protein